MALKTVNKTIDEVERLSELLSTELEKIRISTLSDSEFDRLGEALCGIYDFCLEMEDEEGEEDEGEDIEELDNE